MIFDDEFDFVGDFRHITWWLHPPIWFAVAAAIPTPNRVHLRHFSNALKLVVDYHHAELSRQQTALIMMQIHVKVFIVCC